MMYLSIKEKPTVKAPNKTWAIESKTILNLQPLMFSLMNLNVSLLFITISNFYFGSFNSALYFLPNYLVFLICNTLPIIWKKALI